MKAVLSHRLHLHFEIIGQWLTTVGVAQQYKMTIF